MREQKKAGKLRIVILCMIGILIVTGILLWIHFGRQKNVQMDEFDSYVYNILSYNIETLDDEFMDPYQEASFREVVADHEVTCPEEVYFVYGFENMYYGDYEQALFYFEKAMAAFSSETNPEVLARTYYEVYSIYDFDMDYEHSRPYGELFEEVIDRVEDIYFRIAMYDWYALKLLNVPGGIDKSIVIMEKNYELAKTVDYPDLASIAYMLADLYNVADNSVQEMHYKLESLYQADKAGDNSSLLMVTANLGIDYLLDGYYDKALEYLDRSLTIELEDKEYETFMRGYICMNIASAYIEAEEADKAKEYIDKAEEYISREDIIQSENDYTYLKLMKAEYDILVGKYIEASILLGECLEEYNEALNFAYSAFDIEIYRAYGNLYYKMCLYNESVSSFEQVQKLCEERGYQYQDVYMKGFYFAYKALGNSEKAYEYAEQIYTDLEDSYREVQAQQADYMYEQYESQKKDARISELETKTDRMIIAIVFYAVIGTIILVFTIITLRKNREIKRLNQKFKQQSELDGLTGLNNRRSLNEYVTENWEKLCLEEGIISVVMTDVDFFKKYNDFYGHLKGDDALIGLAEVLKKHKRKKDFVARYGGEEFAIIMPGTDGEEAKQTMLTIQEELERLQIMHEKSAVSDHVTMSVGIYSVTEPIPYEKAFTRADEALYQAKETRNTIVVTKD